MASVLEMQVELVSLFRLYSQNSAGAYTYIIQGLERWIPLGMIDYLRNPTAPQLGASGSIDLISSTPVDEGWGDDNRATSRV